MPAAFCRAACRVQSIIIITAGQSLSSVCVCLCLCLCVRTVFISRLRLIFVSFTFRRHVFPGWRRGWGNWDMFCVEKGFLLTPLPLYKNCGNWEWEKKFLVLGNRKKILATFFMVSQFPGPPPPSQKFCELKKKKSWVLKTGKRIYWFAPISVTLCPFDAQFSAFPPLPKFSTGGRCPGRISSGWAPLPTEKFNLNFVLVAYCLGTSPCWTCPSGTLSRLEIFNLDIGPAGHCPGCPNYLQVLYCRCTRRSADSPLENLVLIWLCVCTRQCSIC